MKKLMLLSTLALCACGTIFSGTTQKITIDSNVDKAKIYIDGIEVCQTPCSTSIDRSSDSIQVTAKKKGYNDKVITLRSSVNRTSYWNLIGLYSWSTDGISGGVWEYKNNNLYIEMERSGMTAAEQKLFEKQSDVRHFALFNYDELNIENSMQQVGEYTQALSELSGLSLSKIKKIQKDSDREAVFANTLAAAMQ